MTDITNKLTFRFQFSDQFNYSMDKFAKLTSELNKSEFDIKFEEFCEKKTNEIKNEENALKNAGFNGDIKEKMYKSIRYYLKNKKEVSYKKRRKYITIPRDMLYSMDSHIESIISKTPTKPADCYKEFIEDEKFKTEIENCKDSIKTKSRELSDKQITDDEITIKIKKTYKNRYFLIQKRMKETTEKDGLDKEN